MRSLLQQQSCYFFTLLFHLGENNGNKLLIWKYVLVYLLISGGMLLTELSRYSHPISSIYGTMYTINPGLASAYNQTIRYIIDSKSKSVLIVHGGAIALREVQALRCNSEIKTYVEY